LIQGKMDNGGHQTSRVTRITGSDWDVLFLDKKGFLRIVSLDEKFVTLAKSVYNT